MSQPSSELTETSRMGRIRPMRRVLILLGLVAASFALVACNGDHDNGDDETATQTGGTATATSTATGTATATSTGTSTGTATGTATETATSTPSGGGSAGAIAVEMIDINYDPKEITATVDEELTIDFENTGALEHTFTIDEIPADDVTEEFQGDEADIDVVLQPGESGTLTFTPTEAGEYEFYCTVIGHREAGMVGTLTVE